MATPAGSLESLRELNRLRVVDALRVHGHLSRADISRTTGPVALDDLDAGRRPARPRASSPSAPSRRPSAPGRAARRCCSRSTPRPAPRSASTSTTTACASPSPTSRGRCWPRPSPPSTSTTTRSTALDAAGRLVDDGTRGGGGRRARACSGSASRWPGPSTTPAARCTRRRSCRAGRTSTPPPSCRHRLELPVHIDNDANLGALAEVTLGAGRNARHALYVQVSSGIGAGLIVDGRPYRGFNGVAGEIGHIAVDDTGPICRCGNRGCLEMLASGPALTRVLRTSRGEDLTVAEMIDARPRRRPRRAARDRRRRHRRRPRASPASATSSTPRWSSWAATSARPASSCSARCARASMRSALPTATEGIDVVAGVAGGASQRARRPRPGHRAVRARRRGADRRQELDMNAHAQPPRGGAPVLRGTTKTRRLAVLTSAVVFALAAGAAGCGDDDDGGSSGSADSGDGGGGKKIAFLLPETKTARYETQDKPRFEKTLKEQCPDCELLYSNADQDAVQAAAAGRGGDHPGRERARPRPRRLRLRGRDRRAGQAGQDPGRLLRPPDPRRRHRLLRLVRQREGRQAAGRGAASRRSATRRARRS